MASDHYFSNSSFENSPDGVRSVCVLCGHLNSQSLYREYKPGAIQLNQCVNCHQFIDKYIEYDKVILLLDMFLLRIQSYRHLIFNYEISTSNVLEALLQCYTCKKHLVLRLLLRLLLILIFCHGYIESYRYVTATPLLIHLNFHLSLAMALTEFCLICLTSVLVHSLLKKDHSMLDWNRFLRVIVLSHFIDYCTVIVTIWINENYTPIAILLLFYIPAQVQCYRALFTDHWFKLLIIVLLQSIVLKTANAFLFTKKTEFINNFVL